MRCFRVAVIVLCAGVLGAAAAAAQFPQARRSSPVWHIGTTAHLSAKASVDIGNFYLRRKDYRGALSRFREAVKTDGYYAPAYLGLGKAYDKMGLAQEALGNYQKYLDNLDSEKQAERAHAVHRAMKRLRQQIAGEHAANVRYGWKPRPAPRAR